MSDERPNDGHPNDRVPDDGVPSEAHPTGDWPELGRLLRDEIPAPGPGYWNTIDERIAAVAAETPSDEDRGSIDPDVDNGDTDTNVIRLTDMTTRPTPRLASAPTLIGIAATLLVLLAVGFALTRGDTDPVQVATDTDGENGISIVDPDPPTDPDDATVDDEPVDPNDEPVDPNDEPVAADDTTDEVAGPDPDPNPNPNPGSNPPIEFQPGEVRQLWQVVDADVAVLLWPGTGQEFSPLDPETVLLGTGRRALLDEVRWVELAPGEERPALWVRETDLVEFIETPFNPDEIVYLEDDEEPRIWSVVGTGTVEARVQPGLDGAVAGTYQPGESFLPGTARRAYVDDMLWIQLEGGAERARAWVPRDRLELTAPDLACYATEDWSTAVLAVEFTDDGTFTGGLVQRNADGLITHYLAVAGSVIQERGSVYEVNVSPGESTEVTTEEWLATGDGFSLADRAFTVPTACALITDSVVALELLAEDPPPLP